MPLSAGTKLGTYEVTAAIGAGGMGEVYQAHDGNLRRDVAIKVLPEVFAHDAERLSRFRREAQLLAALNHSNIATIYGLENSNGTSYLVMELVPGDTLAQRIKRDGPVPVEEALTIAKQIAEALEAAHEKSIIHRDLKPANVKVTPEGKVKVLDFGLAKAFAGDTSTEDMSNSPTLSMAATMQGVILGTAAYMSPEQARGKAVDKRTDIWAFGCVLFELLTGKQAFHGEDVTDILAAVVRAEPDWMALPANISPSIRVLLQRCLRKDRRQRTPDAAILRIEIEDALAAPKDFVPRQTAFESRSKLPWVSVAALAIVAAGASFIAFRATRPVERPLMRFADQQDAEISIAAQEGPAVAISPDGSLLAFVSQGAEQTTHISLRPIENSKSTILEGTEGAAAPFFSPDGHWIGFFTGNTLKKISVQGGAAVSFCEVGGPPRGGGFWGEDGNIYFASQLTPVMRIPANGGTPSAATELDTQKGEVSNRGAQLLPGGEALLFNAAKDNNVWENDSFIEVQYLKTGKRKTLVQGGYFGHYIHGSDPASGHLIYTHAGTLFAAPMDLKRLELTGPALPVLENMAGRSANGFTHLGITDSGSMVYIVGPNLSSQQSLFWLDAVGNARAMPAPPREYVYPRFSPDGTRIALGAVDASGLYIADYELVQNRMTKLTFWKGVSGFRPVWAPDGKHVLFLLTSSELAGPGIYWIRSDGAGEPQRLIEGRNVGPSSFTPDGKHLAYLKLAQNNEIWTVQLDLADPEHPKTGKPELFLGSKFDLRGVAFSPDGRWIAYRSAESGQPEVFVRPFPGPGGKWQVSTAGGSSPIWSPNGHELFYQGRDMMVVAYSVKDESFVAGQPRPWSEKTLPIGNSFDLSPDGKRFVVVMRATSTGSAERLTHVEFLMNFSDELQRKVPIGK